MTVIKEV